MDLDTIQTQFRPNFVIKDELAEPLKNESKEKFISFFRPAKRKSKKTNARKPKLKIKL